MRLFFIFSQLYTIAKTLPRVYCDMLLKIKFKLCKEFRKLPLKMFWLKKLYIFIIISKYFSQKILETIKYKDMIFFSRNKFRFSSTSLIIDFNILYVYNFPHVGDEICQRAKNNINFIYMYINIICK